MQYIHKYNENRELRPFDKKFVQNCFYENHRDSILSVQSFPQLSLSYKYEKSTLFNKNSVHRSSVKDQDLIDVEMVEKLRLALKIACFEFSFNLVKI